MSNRIVAGTLIGHDHLALRQGLTTVSCDATMVISESHQVDIGTDHFLNENERRWKPSQ